MSTHVAEFEVPAMHEAKQNLDLRARLSAYEIDDPTSGLTFTERLARENFWTLSYARRVVLEYKRFLELTVVAGHTCCPSDAVDQAWHQHLVYTRSYWDDLCKNVLQSPLHHGPTRGGHQEQQRYRDLYATTLKSYRTVFGMEPPVDIWPCGEERFMQSAQSIRVDQGKYWVIPKLTGRHAAMAGGAASFPAIIALANPLDFAGPEFIKFFAIASVSALVVGIAIRSYRTRLSPTEANKAVESCGWALTAMLTSGNSRAVLAAVTRLREEQRIDMDSGRLVATQFFSPSAIPMEFASAGSALSSHSSAMNDSNPNKEDEIFKQSVFDEIASNKEGISFSALINRCKYQSKRLAVQLEDKGLVSAPSNRRMQQFASITPLAVVIALGIPKAWLGVQRDRPIGFLVIMLIACAIASFALFKSVPRRTALGDKYLDELKKRFSKPASKFSEEAAWSDDSVESKPKRLEQNEDIPMYAAIYGASVLGVVSMNHDALFYQSLSTQTTASSDSFLGSGDTSSSGCGGDSGGDAGGCGGGCGGCGGCGG